MTADHQLVVSRKWLRSILVLNINERGDTLRPIFAIDLLDGFRMVQCVLIVDRTSLDDLHTWRGGNLNPHDRAAGRAVVVCHVLVGCQKETQKVRSAERSYLSGIAFASEGAVGAGELLVLDVRQRCGSSSCALTTFTWPSGMIELTLPLVPAVLRQGLQWHTATATGSPSYW
jgi:hypothetical protein